MWINFQDYFCIHQSFLLNIQDCINNKWRFIRFSVLIKLRKKIFSAFRRRHNTTEIFTFTCYFMFQVFLFLRNFFVLKDISNSKNDDDDDDDDDELLLCYVWPTKSIWPYCQLGTLLLILTIADLQHVVSRTWFQT